LAISEVKTAHNKTTGLYDTHFSGMKKILKNMLSVDLPDLLPITTSVNNS
jgi:hypothetical protein